MGGPSLERFYPALSPDAMIAAGNVLLATRMFELSLFSN